MTNKAFALSDEQFQTACTKANLPEKKHEKLGLKRQASKWRNKKGKAWKER